MAKSVAPFCSSKRFPLRPRGPVSHLLISPRHIFHPNTLLEGLDAPPHTAGVPDQSEQLPTVIDQSFPTDPGALGDHLIDLVAHLRPLLPAGCGWLEQGSPEVFWGQPVDAGGVADIRAGKIGNRKVAIKVYRYDSSSNYSVTYARFRNEVFACSRLNGGNIVPFIGVYSTPEHPLALVFEFMGHLNLREYLRSNVDVGRCKLLLEAARGVEYVHQLNVVHGNLKITNILVDARGHGRVAGLGSAFLLSAGPEVNIDTFFHGAAPELVDPRRFGFTDTGATRASDVYAFGVLAWEVFAGRVPFSDEGGVAGVYSMLSGRRPPRADHPELSDNVWGMIKGCWECFPSRRKTITEVIAVLNAELD